MSMLALVVVALTAATPDRFAGAAVASHKDSPYVCSASYQSCLKSRILIYQGEVWGSAYYLGPSPTASALVTIVVHQCDGLGRNCVGPISANRPRIATGTWGSTSKKPVSLGHTYRACASGAGVVNLCSPLIAWNA